MARPALHMTTKTSDMRSVDLAWLRRNGARNPGYQGVVSWTRNGEVRASVNYYVEQGGIRLSYTCRRHGGEPMDVNELVPVITTPTRFGGVRHWFRCLSCQRRCRIVYGGTHFRCRRCHRLKYESQYEAEPNRISERRWRIRQLLEERGGGPWPFGLDDGFPDKPPRMHWRTYRQLEALDERLSCRWSAAVEARLAHLPRR